MRSSIKLLASAGLLLGVMGSAQAQTQNVYLNSLVKITGTGTEAFIGDDPGTSNVSGAALTAATSGYAVLPFTTTASAPGTDVVNQVQINGVFNAPTGSGTGSTTVSNIGSLYGVIIENPNTSVGFNTTGTNTGNSTKTIGGFFAFDTSVAQATPGATAGDGAFHTFTANITNGATLKASTTYWLVVLPKSDLTPAANSDPLTHYFAYDARTLAAIRSGNLSTSFATESAGLVEGTMPVGTSQSGGAQIGDSLVTLTDSNSPSNSLYFGAKITAATPAAVPEASTLVSLSLGVITMGGLALRRRRASKA